MSHVWLPRDDDSGSAYRSHAMKNVYGLDVVLKVGELDVRSCNIRSLMGSNILTGLLCHRQTIAMGFSLFTT